MAATTGSMHTAAARMHMQGPPSMTLSLWVAQAGYTLVGRAVAACPLQRQVLMPLGLLLQPINAKQSFIPRVHLDSAAPARTCCP